VVDRSADPYAKNARTHTDAQIAAIAASIKEWGWTTPALVGWWARTAG
jgi:ParB-like chromosome segregation protein Spo0J